MQVTEWTFSLLCGECLGIVSCSTPVSAVKSHFSIISILTNTDTSRTIRPVERVLSVLASEKMLILLDFFGATRRIRTDDLLITNQLLYQLS